MDLDGVICQWSEVDSLIEAAHGLPQGCIRPTAFASELLMRVMRGAVPDETWRADIAQRLTHLAPEASTAQAVAAWSASPGSANPEVLAVLARCRPHPLRQSKSTSS